MNKKALVFIVVFASFSLTGCEFIIILEVLSTSIQIQNDSSETIESCHIFDPVDEMWTVSQLWAESDQTIPIGKYHRIRVATMEDQSFRFESATMYWEFFFSAWEADWNETVHWALTDINSSSL